MKKQDDLRLTQILFGITKWSGKKAFWFTVLTIILVGVLLSNADPRFNSYSLNEGETEQVKTFNFESEERMQMIFIVDAKSSPGQAMHAKILFEVLEYNSDSASYESFIRIISEGGVRDITFSNGRFLVQITNLSPDTSVEVFFSYGNVNYGLLAAVVISAILMSISMAIFFTVLPFAVFALILNAINQSQSYPPQPKPMAHKELSQTKSQAQAQATVQSMSPTPSTDQELTMEPGSHKYTIHKREGFSLERLFDNFTRKDWMVFSVGLAFFAWFFVSSENGFLFVSVIIISSAIYNVTEREKIKQRIIILLNDHPNTSLLFLAKHLDKKKKSIRRTLEVMIFEDMLPISFNPINESVTLKKHVEIEMIHPAKPAQQINNSSPTVDKIASEKGSSVSQVPVESIDVKVPKSYCANCGDGLVEDVVYCYTCGEKQ